jgi:hypothetical protein
MTAIRLIFSSFAWRQAMIRSVVSHVVGSALPDTPIFLLRILSFKEKENQKQGHLPGMFVAHGRHGDPFRSMIFRVQ